MRALTCIALAALAVPRAAEAADAVADALERARRIEEAHGPASPELADALARVGVLLYQIGASADAVPHFERALRIRESLPGQPRLAATLANLGGILWQTGEYSRARPHLERAVGLARQGGSKQEIARALNAHGLLQHAVGDLEEARKTLAESLEIFELEGAPGDVSKALNNLGLLLEESGDAAAARRTFERALKLAGDDPALRAHRATCLNSLGWSHHSSGEHAEARRSYEAALELRREALGADHPDVAWPLANLGLLDEDLGRFEEARKLHEQALALREAGLGADHPLVAQSLGDLARALAALGSSAEALRLAVRSEEIGREHARLTLRALPERQALRHLSARGARARRTQSLDLLLSLAREAKAPGATRAALDALVRSRALALDELASRLRLVQLEKSPEARDSVTRLRSARERLANLRYRGLQGEAPERYRASIEAARREAEEIESRLARLGESGSRDAARGRVQLEDVAASLPARALLIAYVRHREPGRASRGGEVYSAFVLPSGREPDLIPLGRAIDVDEAVAKFHLEASQGALSPGRPSVEAEARAREAGDALRRKVWDPVASRIAGARRVFVVPDSSLHVVSFGALPDAASGYLVESAPEIHLLTAERDLSEPPPSRRGRGLFAIGGPAFGDAEAGEPAFAPLPSAEREVRRAAELWAERFPQEPTVVVRGPEASESAFKEQAAGKRMAHVATHGFFLSSTGMLSRPGTRGLGRVVAARTARKSDSLGFAALAFAGANRSLAGSEAPEDGILSAEEVSVLDLSGMELAVLSACDTGAGDIQAGEGVLGLRRAFQLAGAQGLVVSLWAVEDDATRAWMEAFYRSWLPGGRSAAEAARAASLEVLRERRGKGLSTHPFFWAGFVAVGRQ